MNNKPNVKFYNGLCEIVAVVSKDRSHIYGRALLWDAILKQQSGDTNVKYLDRVYSNYEHIIKYIREYGRKNSYYKRYGSSHSDTSICDKNGYRVDSEICISPKLLFDRLSENAPYMDTFKYINIEKDKLSLSNIKKSDNYFIISYTNNYFSYKNGNKCKLVKIDENKYVFASCDYSFLDMFILIDDKFIKYRNVNF